LFLLLGTQKKKERMAEWAALPSPELPDDFFLRCGASFFDSGQGKEGAAPV
jgi:hypothetical protein